MLEKLNREKLFRLYQVLPPELKEALFSEVVADKIYQIAKIKYGLPDDQVSEVARTIGRVMMGLIRFNNFIPTLINKVGLTEEMAKSMTKDISNSIFLPLKVSLLKVQPKEEVAPLPKSTPPPVIIPRPSPPPPSPPPPRPTPPPPLFIPVPPAPKEAPVKEIPPIRPETRPGEIFYTPQKPYQPISEPSKISTAPIGAIEPGTLPPLEETIDLSKIEPRLDKNVVDLRPE